MLHIIESLAILCYKCSNGSIIHNISFEDFIANIAMDIPSYILLNDLQYYVTNIAMVVLFIIFHLKISLPTLPWIFQEYYVTYVAIVLLIRNRFSCHGSDS
jgi:hypothetical protein